MLDAALAQVVKYGWTVEALSLAAAEQGLSNLAHGLFRRVRRFPPFVFRSGSSICSLNATGPSRAGGALHRQMQRSNAGGAERTRHGTHDAQGEDKGGHSRSFETVCTTHRDLAAGMCPTYPRSSTNLYRNVLFAQAIAILAQPSNASTSFSLMFNTINDIIYVAGDSTVDVRALS